jgi:hypothetical protein
MIPLLLFSLAESSTLGSLGKRVARLERALSLTLELLQILVERLDAKLGQGDMKRLAAEAHEDVQRIDELVRQKKRPAAAKLFREVAGVTWDEAHQAIGSWSSYTLEQKVQCLRLARWVKTLQLQRGSGG